MATLLALPGAPAKRKFRPSVNAGFTPIPNGQPVALVLQFSGLERRVRERADTGINR
jgi:hypothetical protein